MIISGLEKLLKNIDMYGEKFEFILENESTRAKSVYGGVISFMTFCFFVFTFIAFGGDLYYKTNPKLIIEEKILSDSDINTLMSVPISNKTIIFKVTQLIDDYTNFLIDVAVPFTNFTQYSYSLMQKCPDEKIVNKFYEGNWTLARTEVNISFSYLCYDLASNRFGLNNDQEANTNSLSIPTTIWTFACGKEKRGVKGKPCPGSYDNLNGQTVYLEVWAEEVLFDQSNLKSPYFTNYERITKVVLTRIGLTTTWLAMKVHRVIDNLGFLLDTYSQKEEYGASSWTHVESTFPQQKDNFNYSLYVGFQRKYISYTRTYMKFQDLLALVGGVVKSVFTIFQILIYLINDRIMKNLFIRLMNFDLTLSKSIDGINNNIKKPMIDINQKAKGKENLSADQSSHLDMHLGNNFMAKSTILQFKKEEGNKSEFKLLFCSNKGRKQLILLANEYRSIEILTSAYRTMEVLTSLLLTAEQVEALKYVKTAPKQLKSKISISDLKKHFSSNKNDSSPYDAYFQQKLNN